MPPLTFGSVCSGIEAASVAWHQLGWRAEWLGEIEPFPSFVLNHHYGSGRPLNMPDPGAAGLSDEDRDARSAAIKAVSKLPLVTTGPRNLGDMTRIEKMVRDGKVSAPDILVGGTPCQAFSIAGLRGGLDDARGQLTIAYFKLANEIDATRAFQGKPPAIIVWENVPGVLSDKSNAFGCFLAGLAGEDCELEPPRDSRGRRKSWPNAGCVFGPQRTIAWRVIDAQYTGVAQRRRRVFVVASARDDIDPTEILFEFDGVRRDFAPSRETAEDLAGTVRASAARRGGVQDECELGLQPVAFGGNNQSGPIDIATARNACGSGSGSGRLDFETETLLVQAISAPVTRSVERPRGDGLDTLIAGTLQANGKAAGSATQQDAESGLLIPIAFDSRQDYVSSTEVFGALGSSSPQAQAIAFSCKDNGRDATMELAPTLHSMGHSGSHANGGGQMAVCVTGDITHILKADGFDASEDGTGRGQPIAAAHAFDARQSDVIQYGDFTGPLDTCGFTIGVQQSMAVRRLTPRECERLQGFPDDYTLIPGMRSSVKADDLEEWVTYLRENYPMITREEAKVMASDGPRYKALGNSMAVPCMLFIGTRIQQHLQLAA